MKKLLIFLFLFVAGSVSTCFAEEAQIKQYVSDLLNQTFDILNDNKTSIDQKKPKLQELLKNNLDHEYMSIKSLGRFKNRYKPEELKEFAVAYQNYLVRGYASAVKNYNGQKVDIKSIERLQDQSYLVQMLISDQNQQVFRINYIVAKRGSGFKILDVITEGISLLSTQKSEFAGILTNNDLAFLTKELKAKTN